MTTPRTTIGFLLALGLAACSSGSSSETSSSTTGSSTTGSSTTGGGTPTPTGFVILGRSGQALEAVPGDALPLVVEQSMSDGSVQPLPSGAQVTWSAPVTVTALPPNSAAPSPIPAFGAQPTAIWIDNPGRPDRGDDLSGVLFVLDLGTPAGTTLSVAATISGVTPAGQANATIALAAPPSGDATRGANVYGSGGANCARCHGATGHGTDPISDGGTYDIAGAVYDFPAPGLNAEPGNLGSDPAWNAALLAMAARADMDNEGVTLRLPMVDWLTTTTLAGELLTTQDFADIYAFLQTQTQ